MNYQDIENLKNERMSAEEVALILSHTIKDVKERKVTLRYALAISRLALALTKTIQVADLNDRVEFLERALKKRK